MTNPDREDHALDALIASFYMVGDEPEPIALDDPAILSDEDRAALDSLGTGDELIERLWDQADAEELTTRLAKVWCQWREQEKQ